MLAPGVSESLGLPIVQVASDYPVQACLASQYAGWQIAVGKFFAMGSGPMRAHYGKEALFDHIPGRESAPHVVGVLEGRKMPNEEVIAWLSEKLQLPAGSITLAIAPTASIAGTVQIVARSLETALHKLHELKFDVNQIMSGFGTAPLPPPAKDDLASIGRTNDAILYGGRVHLWVRGDDAVIAEIGPKVPASASSDYGQPFAEVFKRAGHDFYKLDPLLFAPAVVTFHNLASGRSFEVGKLNEAVMRQSFGAVN
jgi:methenyltetrahydromethanopterin cyclohydrolase